MGIQYFNRGGYASTTQNIRCPSIMTPSKMGKTKNLIFYSLNERGIWWGKNYKKGGIWIRSEILHKIGGLLVTKSSRFHRFGWKFVKSLSLWRVWAFFIFNKKKKIWILLRQIHNVWSDTHKTLSLWVTEHNFKGTLGEEWAEKGS